MRAWFLLPLGLLHGCARDQDAQAAALLAEVRGVLSSRDERLSSYRAAVDTEEGKAKAHHDFHFRAPNLMRGTVTEPETLTLATNGVRFFRVHGGSKTYEAYRLGLSEAATALFLTATFMPFIPEGFRAPLLPRQVVSVRKVPHPNGPEAVEVVVAPRDESGAEARVSYVLRWPSGDFLGKTVVFGDRVESIRVEGEQCDDRLVLCVPRRLTHLTDGRSTAVTALSRIELNAAIPNDFFVLEPPPGYSRLSHEVVPERQLVGAVRAAER
jgi:outer membrane lipoprotein-sorting protein